MRTCEMWSRPEGTGTISTNATGRCVAELCYFVAVLNACANIVALEAGRSAMSRSFKVDGIQMSKWGIACLTCMQNVGACRMHREYSTRCHLEMWSLGLP